MFLKAVIGGSASSAGPRLVSASFALLLVVTTLVVAARSIQADPFGGCSVDTGEGCRADNSLHTFCFAAGFDATLEDEARFAMNTSLDRDTVMTVDYGTTCNEYTDIKWQDVDMGSYRGEYFCLNPYGYSPNAICYAARIRLDPGVINQGSNDEENRKKTACHEVGHSVGLQHGNTKTDCMLNGDVPDTSAQWRTFNQHHIGDHIDPEYG